LAQDFDLFFLTHYTALFIVVYLGFYHLRILYYVPESANLGAVAGWAEGAFALDEISFLTDGSYILSFLDRLQIVSL
jgi:hypothetical protein